MQGLTLLLWKNALLQNRKKIITALEIIIPTIAAIILFIIRQSIKSPKEINGPPAKIMHDQWTLFYAPNKGLPAEIMQEFAERESYFLVKGFPTLEALEYFWFNVSRSHADLGAIIFPQTFSNDSTIIHMTLKIRPSLLLSFDDDDPNSPTDKDIPDIYNIEFESQLSWYEDYSWFIPRFYKGLFDAIINKVSVITAQKINPNYVSMYTQIIFGILPWFMMLSFVLTTLTIVREIIQEKEQKLKESMKIMGLSNWLHWLAWFIIYFIITLISVIIIIIFLVLNVGRGAVIPKSSPFLIFIFLVFYAVSVIFFSFAVSVFFSRANSGTAAAVFLWFLLFIPYTILEKNYNMLSWIEKISSCLSFNNAMALGFKVMHHYEGRGIGIQFSNWNTPISPGDITLLQVLIMFGIDSFIYFLIMWYVEAVFPGEFGVPQRFYFPFQASYWNGVNTSQEPLPSLDDTLNTNKEYFEEEPTDIPAGIQIFNLSKIFGRGKEAKVAVNHLTLNMYLGQITALLGHNGAGKTTTMSILTGLIPPSQGYALVDGHNITTDISGARKSLGLCPQHNVLFDKLTVEEHLRFFGLLKGFSKTDLNSEIDRYIAAVKLQDKKNVYTETLSGGMKRKLSVAIALIGQSKVVMLDEPTSGMDPAARREIWDLLQKERENRTILLTTHHMDEADLLGDRIAIMANGKVQCCGSSIFLKSKYGANYHLTIVKDTNCDVPSITSLIESYIPLAEKMSNIAAELSYTLPHDCSERFEDLFSEMEQKQAILGMSSFGISVTTLEEIFFKVGESYDPSLKVSLQGGNLPDISQETNTMESVKHNTGMTLHFQQFYAMCLKKALNSFRNWKLMIAQLVIPIFYSYMILIIIYKQPNYHQQHEINHESSIEETTISTDVLLLHPNDKNLKTRDDIKSELLLHLTSLQNTSNVIDQPVTLVQDNGMAVALNLLFSLSFLVSSFVIFIIKENISKAKHLQVISGVHSLTFWLANFFWDLINYMIPSIIILLGFQIFDTQGFSRSPQIFYITFQFFLYGCSIIPFMYLLSFMFSGPTKGYVILCVLNFFSGMITIIVISILTIPDLHLQSQAQLCHAFFLIFPNYCFGTALIDLCKNWRFNQICAQIPHSLNDCIMLPTPCCKYYCGLDSPCYGQTSDPFSWKGLGVGAVTTVMVAEAIIYFLLVLLIDSGLIRYSCYNLCSFCKRIKNNTNAIDDNTSCSASDDADVSNERNRIHENSLQDLMASNILILKDLSKYYGEFLAVDKLCLAVPNGECFGLLGINGAGKTSTFKMLTGDEIISAGDAFISSFNIKTDIKKVQRSVGYCPQFDALIDHMSGRELLFMFARLRGTPEKIIPTMVEKLLQDLLLTEHADKYTSAYSGGNKRKLSTAIALVGKPPILLLDEPTTGMDPVARRMLWNVLSTVRNYGKSIILTSHSMEECEALCTRLAIMVNGKFRCLGSIQHLKNKYSQGFTLIVKAKPDTNMEKLSFEMKCLCSFIEQTFEGSQLRDLHQSLVQYHIPTVATSCSRIFGIMAKAKIQFNLEDYSVSQTTLEQVFLNLVRDQITHLD